MLSANPKQVFIALDAAFAMQRDWAAVPITLNQLAASMHYAQFAMATGKGTVHGWQDRPDASTVVAYGPRRLNKAIEFSTQAGATAADHRILLTNAQNTQIAGWQVIPPVAD